MDNSKIEWTDHTFNPWWGCQKVSDGCKFCHAETMDNRWAGGHWGPGSQRKVMSEAYWQKPINWNRAAQRSGKQAKVFCASMADVFEGHQDTLPHLGHLFTLIERTPHLIWQLLTKRPENILPLLRQLKQQDDLPYYTGLMIYRWLDGTPPANVWIGTSVENQKTADERIPLLLAVPAVVRFLSCEPLLGPIQLVTYFKTEGTCSVCGGDGSVPANNMATFDEAGGGVTCPTCMYDNRLMMGESGIQWVIVGGESGHHARPVHPDWVRSLRNQCKAAGIAYFFKQWGEYHSTWKSFGSAESIFKMYTSYLQFTQKLWVNKGDACISIDGKLCKIGKDFQECTYPVAIMQKVGKKLAGRLLDGREWNEFPQPK